MLNNDKVNIPEVCKKILYRLLEINIGSGDGEDLFTNVCNRHEVIEEAKKYLREFNTNTITEQELKEKISKIEILNDIEFIKYPHYGRHTIFGDQFDWMFETDTFTELLYKPWEQFMGLYSKYRGFYEDYKNEFDAYAVDD